MPSMFHSKILQRVAGLLLPFCLLIGCGEKGPDGMPALTPLTLQFTQGGKPLADAAIQLIPADPTSRWVSGGGTDQTGKCVVRTHGTYVGAPTGKYKVCVIKNETEGEPEGMDMSNPGQSKPSTLKTVSLVDLKFTLPNTTPLELEVTESGEPTQTFELGEPTRSEVARPPA